MDSNIKERIARAVVNTRAVGFSFDNPIVFKSGIFSPVYIDNRKTPFSPDDWGEIILSMAELIQSDKILLDIIAGVETAGIPHGAALAYETKRPFVFVRKDIKNHGTKKRVEGGDISDRQVLLVEDHVTMAGSSLDSVQALRNEAGIVTDCLSITTYAFPEAEAAFVAAGVVLHALTEFSLIFDFAVEQKILTPEQRVVVDDWLQDPHHWGEKNGFSLAPNT